MIKTQISLTHVAYNITHAISNIHYLYVVIGIFLLTALITLSFLPFLSNQSRKTKHYNITFIVLMFVTIIFYRLPYLQLMEQNVDESEEIAAAITLLFDPVYWRSVALGTHGPLSTYPLLIPHFVGFQIDYGSAKLIATLMLIIGIICMLSFFRKVLSEKLAMIAVLPVILFICLSGVDDFIAYNAEVPVAFITALSIWLIGNIITSKDKYIAWHVYISGFVIGCAPFIKMQSVPIVLALIIFSGFIISKKSRISGNFIKLSSIFATGCITVSLLVCCYIWYFDLFNDFAVRYLQGQLNYAKLNDHSTYELFKLFIANLYHTDSECAHFFSLLMLSSIIIGIIAVIHNKINSSSNTNNKIAITISSNKIVLLSLLFVTAMSMYAVLIPGKGYEHYFLLIVFPLAYFTGSFFISRYNALNLKSFKIGCIAIYTVTTVLVPLAYRKDMLLADIIEDNSPPTKSIDQMITTTIKEYSRPGEKMVVWGWADKYYIYTQLIRGCKTEFISFIHDVYGNQEYYYNSFYNELVHSHAPVILDTVAPNQLAFNNKAVYGFENYPQIAEYINSNYSCIKDFDGNRIYISNQRLKDPNFNKH